MNPRELSSTSFAHDGDRWQKLREIIKNKSLLTGEFKLTSGRTSNYLFQLRQTTMHPEGSALIGDLIVDFMKDRRLTCVGGKVHGAVPVVAAVSVMSHLKHYPVDAFFVRNEAKAHGAKEQIDGYWRKDADILIVDDVTTSGGSMLDAINIMREHGFAGTVSHALSIVDRQEGAAENLLKQGIELHWIFQRSDFGL